MGTYEYFKKRYGGPVKKQEEKKQEEKKQESTRPVSSETKSTGSSTLDYFYKHSGSHAPVETPSAQFDRNQAMRRRQTNNPFQTAVESYNAGKVDMSKLKYRDGLNPNQTIGNASGAFTPSTPEPANLTREGQWAAKHPVAGLGMYAVTNYVGGGEGVVNMLDAARREAMGQGKIGANEINAAPLAQAYRTGAAEGIRRYVETSDENLPKVLRAVGNIKQDDGQYTFGEQALDFMTGVGADAASSSLNMAMGGNISTYLMGANAANQSLYDTANDEKTTSGQALALAAANGIAEAFFEKFSVENAGAVQEMFRRNPVSVKDFARTLLVSAGVEGSEEMNTEIANILSDIFIRGENSESGRMYARAIENGADPNAAAAEVLRANLKQIGMAGLGGALSGGLHTGLYSSVGTMQRGMDLHNVTSAADIMDTIDTSTKEGQTAYDIASEIAKKEASGKRATAIDYGRLQNAVDNAVEAASEAAPSTEESVPTTENAAPSIEGTAPSTDDIEIREVPRGDFRSSDAIRQTAENVRAQMDADYQEAFNEMYGADTEGIKGRGGDVEGSKENKRSYHIPVETLMRIDEDNRQNKTYSGLGRYGQETFDAQSFGSDAYDSATSLYNSIRFGQDLTEAEKMRNARLLTDDQVFNISQAAFKDLNSFYNWDRAGKISAIAEKHTLKDVTPGKVTYADGIDIDALRADGSEQARKQVAQMAYAEGLLSKVFGYNVHWIQSRIDDNTGRYIDENGSYDSSTHTISLDINAGANYVGDTIKYSTVIAHELTHTLELGAVEQYKKIADSVMNILVNDEEYSHGRNAQQIIADMIENNPHVHNEAEAVHELVAQACEDMMNGNADIQEMLAGLNDSERQSLFDRISSAFASILKFIEDMLSSDAVKSDRREAEALRRAKEEVEGLRDTWNEGVKNAAIANGLESAFGDETGNIIRDENGEAVIAESEDGKSMVCSIRTLPVTQQKLAEVLKEKGYSAESIKAAQDQVQDLADMMTRVSVYYAEMAEALDAELLVDPKTGKTVLHSFVTNGDYPINIDFLTVCKKREAYMRVLTDLIEHGVFDKVAFNGAAIATTNEILRDSGFETACACCFVESRRLQIQRWAETFCSEWNEEVLKRNPNATPFNFSKGERGANDLTQDEIIQLENELRSVTKKEKNPKGNIKLPGKGARANMGPLLDRIPSLAHTLSVGDLITPNGIDSLRTLDGNLFSLVKQRYGTATPKITQSFSPYSGDVADLSYGFMRTEIKESVPGSKKYKADAKRELIKEGIKKPAEKQIEDRALRKYLYDIGGVRLQSFSDFLIENTLDYFQMFADLAAKGLPLHAYSKEISFIKIFGMTGGKMNMSLIPTVDLATDKDHAGLKRNADGTWSYAGWGDYEHHLMIDNRSFIQSIGFKDAIAMQLHPGYSSNIGTIAIGISDAHIRMMLNDPLIRMVIPYHSSGMLPEFAKQMHIDYYHDYTTTQNTTLGKCTDMDGNEVEAYSLKGSGSYKCDTHYDFNEAFQRLGDARAACEEYKEWCKEKHPVYKGSKQVGWAEFTPKFAEFAYEPNYYKLIEDFNSYDCITEAPAIQGAVTMSFPGAEENLLDEEQLKAYEERLRATGQFSEKEIQKYVSRANESLEEIITREAKNRNAYHREMDKKYDATLAKIEGKLQKDYNKSDYELVNNKYERKQYSTRGDYAPAFYSKLQREVQNFKGEKIGAASVESYLKGKGVKDEEIKWSGIRTFLEGKKSVSKTELMQYLKANEVRIEEKVLDDKGVDPDIWSNGYSTVNINHFYDPVRGTEFTDEEGFREEANKRFVDDGFDQWGSEIVFNISDDYMSAETEDGFLILEAYPPDPYELRDSDFKPSTNTHWGDYKLSGGENYREVMFKLPGNDYINDAMSVHWKGEKGVLVHARVQDFKTESGEKVLFVDEIQSDWHNAGQKYGYGSENIREKVSNYRKERADYLKNALAKSFSRDDVDAFYSKDRAKVASIEHDKYFSMLDAEMKAENEWNKQNKDKHDLITKMAPETQYVPDAPFRSNYTDLALKSLLRMAAEGDYDYLAWTTGKMQEDRWMSKYAEGYRIEYDQQIPKFLKKYGKQWGAGLTDISVADNEVPAIIVNDAMKESVLYEGQPQFSSRGLDEYDASSPYTAADTGAQYSARITDEALLKKLNDEIALGDYIVTYKAMQLVGDNLYPPMAAKVKNEKGRYVWTNPSRLKVWQESVEDPSNIKFKKNQDYGYYVLNKGDGSSVEAAYNPYEHSSNLVLNDQFEGAYKRDNLVVVKCYIPKSEIYGENRYKAQYAKDSTGVLDWKSGVVAGQLKDNKRQVYLSRYLMPVEIVPVEEVAKMWKETLEGSDVTVPFNVVQPSLLKELEKVGIPIDYEGSPMYKAHHKGESKQYSTRDNTINGYTPSSIGSIEELMRYNSGIRDMSAGLAAALEEKGAQGAKLSDAQVERIARKFIKQYGSEADPKKIAGGLKSMFDYIDMTSKVSASQLGKIAHDYAREILEKATQENKYGDQYPDLKKGFKTANLKLTDELKGDIINTYESVPNFKRKMRGILDISEKGTQGVDTYYEELKGLHPDLFTDDIINPADQLIKIAQVAELLNQKRVKADYGSDIDEFAYVVGQEMVAQYFAEKGDSRYKREVDAIKAEMTKKHQAEMAELRADAAKEYQKLKDRLGSKAMKVAEVRAELNAMHRRVMERRELRLLTKEAKKRLMEQARKLRTIKGSREFESAKRELIGNLDLVSYGMSDGTRVNLEKLRHDALAQAAKDEDYTKTVEYADIMELTKRLDKEKISEMSLEKILMLTKSVLALKNAQQSYNRMLKEELGEYVAVYGRRLVAQQKNISGIRGKSHMLNALKRYALYMENPTRVAHLLDGYQQGGVFTELFDDINAGAIKAEEFKQKADEMFKPVLEDKELNRTWSKQDIPIEVNGQTYHISKGMRISMYLHSLNKDNKTHIKNGGFNIPDEKLYRQGRYTEAYAAGTQVPMDEATLIRIANEMTPAERRFAEVAKDFFNKTTKEAINEVSLQLKGYELAAVDNYFPIRTDPNFTQKEIDGLIHDASIEGAGQFKDRQPGSKNPILLEDVAQVIQRQTHTTAQYYGLAIPVRNANKVWKYTSTAYRNSAKDAVAKNWLTDGAKIFENVLKDIQVGARRGDTGSHLFSLAKGAYAAAVLTANVGVSIKQSASYPLAIHMLDAASLAKGIVGKVDREYMDSITPLSWARRHGMGGQVEVADVFRQKGMIDDNPMLQKMKDLTNWIQAVDVATTDHLFVACEEYVKAHNPGLEVRGDEYNKMVADLYNDVLQRTQPSYGVMQRNELMRSSDAIMKALTMFKTQTFNMGGELLDAGLRVNALSEMQKKGWVTKEEVNGAKRNMANVVGATIMSQAMLAILATMANALLHKMKPYRDDEGKVTMESVAAKTARDFGASFFGLFFGLDVASQMATAVTGGKWYDVTAPQLDGINEAISATSKWSEALSKYMNGSGTKADLIKQSGNMAIKISGAFGIPANNVYNIANAINLWVQDGRNRTLFESGESILGINDTGVTDKQYYNRMWASLYVDKDWSKFITDYNRMVTMKDADTVNSKLVELLSETDEVKEAAAARRAGNAAAVKSAKEKLGKWATGKAALAILVDKAIDKVVKASEPKEEKDKNNEAWNGSDQLGKLSSDVATQWVQAGYDYDEFLAYKREYNDLTERKKAELEKVKSEDRKKEINKKYSAMKREMAEKAVRRSRVKKADEVLIWKAYGYSDVPSDKNNKK